LYPDFQTGGLIDVTDYNQGKRGGKVKVRAHIEEWDKKTLVIRSVPYGVTTMQLMESIVKANDQGKIKIKKVTDNTAADVEILVDLAAGISPDITIDALYKFTDCEISISPNACVIAEQKPQFLGVQELLRFSVDNTKSLLEQELRIRLSELQEKWHYTSLEKIFFEEKIYKELEKKHSTWDKVLAAIEEAFSPFVKKLKRPVTREDVLKLTEKPVRRIYKLDIDELNEQIRDLESAMKQVRHDLDHLIDFAVAYYEGLLKKYGKGKERRTEIKEFEVIEAKHVAIANTKLYVSREEGFIGTGLKKDELLFECSDLDDIIAITKRGILKVVKVAEKSFIGKDILHVAIFQKNDERTTYNMIYADGKGGVSYAKRFTVTGVTRDKEYDLTKGDEKSKVHYLSVNLNGEAEVVKVLLTPGSAARIKEFDFYFETLAVKGRSSMGNQVTKYPIRQVKFKEAGKSTLSAKKLWFDDQFGRLNSEGKGMLLGSFDPEELLLVIYSDGNYEITDQEVTQKFDPDKVLQIEKFDPKKVITAVYADLEKKQYMLKRFLIETSTLKSKFCFIKEGAGNYVEAVTTDAEPVLAMQQGKGAQIRKAKLKLSKIAEVSGWKTVGTKLADFSKSTEMEWVKISSSGQPELFET
jgi:topoisomerase-4 subunit A